MIAPAEFDRSTEEQDTPEAQLLAETGDFIDYLYLSRYMTAEAYQRALRGLRLAQGLPRLEAQYRMEMRNAIEHMKWIKSRIDANLS